MLGALLREGEERRALADLIPTPYSYLDLGPVADLAESPR